MGDIIALLQLTIRRGTVRYRRHERQPLHRPPRSNFSLQRSDGIQHLLRLLNPFRRGQAQILDKQSNVNAKSYRAFNCGSR